jgi:hypothetical protein
MSHSWIQDVINKLINQQSQGEGFLRAFFSVPSLPPPLPRGGLGKVGMGGTGIMKESHFTGGRVR